MNFSIHSNLLNAQTSNKWIMIKSGLKVNISCIPALYLFHITKALWGNDVFPNTINGMGFIEGIVLSR
jgi:hypothetical protein